VASVASRGESGCLVVGIVGVVVILHVAGAAGFVGQVIVAIHVALQAGQLDVCSRKRKARGGVIELSIAPGIRVVTILASRWEPCLLVIGVSSALIVLQVAGHTGGVSDVIIAVDVALGAGGFGVHSGQRETGLGVIEDCVGPG